MEASSKTRSPVVGIGLLFVAAAVVVVAVVSFARVTAPLGDSDEGINATVWASNSRALRELGPVDSRMGGLRLDDSLYATHPPMIVVETALAESVLGEREWVSRLPAWLGSLCALGLLYALLRRLGVTSAVAGGATAATALSPMLWIYGPMLDTPVTSFPFGLAVVWAWFRQWRATPGTWAVHPAVAGLLAFLAAVSGWQATVLIAMCALTLLVRGVRGRPGGWREALPLIVGGAAGFAVSLAWIRWTYGDFDVLTDKFGGRSGSSSGVGVTDMVDFQIPWLVQLLGAGLIGLGACVVALWTERYRPLAAMSLASVGVYAVLFRQAAAGHQYWNYWVLLPVAVGFAFLFERLARDAKTRAVAVLAGVVVAVGCVNLFVVPTDAADAIDAGHEVVELVQASDPPADQKTAWYIGQQFRPDAWLAYYTDQAPLALTSQDELEELAAGHPDHLVIVLGRCQPDEPTTELCEAEARTSEAPGPRVVTARELADQLATSP